MLTLDVLLNTPDNDNLVSYVTTFMMKHDSSKGISGKFLIDTGAQVSIMNNATYEELTKYKDIKLKNIPTKVRAANGEEIPFLGIANIDFTLDIQGKYKFKHDFWIAAPGQSCKANILGMNWIPKGDRHPENGVQNRRQRAGNSPGTRNTFIIAQWRKLKATVSNEVRINVLLWYRLVDAVVGLSRDNSDKWHCVVRGRQSTPSTLCIPALQLHITPKMCYRQGSRKRLKIILGQQRPLWFRPSATLPSDR